MVAGLFGIASAPKAETSQLNLMELNRLYDAICEAEPVGIPVVNGGIATRTPMMDTQGWDKPLTPCGYCYYIGDGKVWKFDGTSFQEIGPISFATSDTTFVITGDECTWWTA